MGAATAAQAIGKFFGGRKSASGDAYGGMSPVEEGPDGLYKSSPVGGWDKLAGGAESAGNLATGVSPMIEALRKKKTPNPYTGKDAGSFQKDYMDVAYPGTSVWDRLGGNTGTPQSAPNSDAGLKQIERLKDKELKNNLDIEKIRSRTSIITGTSGSLAPHETQKAINTAITGVTSEIKDTVYNLYEQNYQKLWKETDEKIKQIIADTTATLAQTPGFVNQSLAAQWDEYKAEMETRLTEANAKIAEITAQHTPDQQKAITSSLKTKAIKDKINLYWDPVKDVISIVQRGSGLGQLQQGLDYLKGDVKQPTIIDKRNPKAFPYKEPKPVGQQNDIDPYGSGPYKKERWAFRNRKPNDAVPY